MLISNVERPSVIERLRARDNDPLRRTAKELGVFLDKLTTAVRSTTDQGDTVDDALQAKNRSASRRFKIPYEGAQEIPLSFTLSEELGEALVLLKEARGIAGAAAMPKMPIWDRTDMQARFDNIFRKLGESPAAAQLQIPRPPEAEPNAAADAVAADVPDGASPFSLLTPDTSRAAYRGVEDIIEKLYDIGTRTADAPADSHEVAVSVSERLKDFLIGEGPASAFARFRDIDRSNILGLLK